MYLKKKDDEVFAIIASILKNHNFVQPVSIEIVNKIIPLLKGTKYCYASIISQIINERKKFKHFYLNLKTLPQTKIEKIVKRVSFLKQYPQSYRSKNNILYANLCAELKIKNTLLNRKLIYKYWLKNFKNNSTKKAIANVIPDAKNMPIILSSQTKTHQIDNSICKQIRESEAFEENYISNDISLELSSRSSFSSVGKRSTTKTVNDDSSDFLLKSLSPITSKQNEQQSMRASFNEKNISNDSSLKSVVDKSLSPEVPDVPKQILNLSSPKNPNILPLGSININPRIIPRVKKDFTITEGYFELDQRLWSTIYKNNRLQKKYYPYVMKRKISNYINNTCIFIFRYVKYKSQSITLRAECKFRNCKNFKITISDRIVSVYSSNINYSHDQLLTGQVRGVERNIVKRLIHNKKPLTLKKDAIIHTKKNLLKTCNLQNIKSDCTFRKIKSELLTANDRSHNYFHDLILYFNDHSDFVRNVSWPLNIKCFCKAQIDVLKREKLCLLHFDATGGIIRKPNLNIKIKRIFVYCGVIQLRNIQRVFPVFSMISATHDSNSIFKILSDFRYFAEEHHVWPAFNGVVTDFSFANLHAISKAFNRQTLIQYIDMCYKLLIETDKYSNLEEYFINNNLTPIYLCCAHFVKMVCLDIEKFFPKMKQGNFFKDLIASTVNFKELEDFDLFIISLFILMNNKYETPEVQCVLETLANMSTIANDVILSEVQEKPMPIIDDSSMYKRSPFFTRFNQKINKIKLDNTHSSNLNPYFNKELFDLILTKYMPYCLFWSALIHKTKRKSNAVAENFFAYLKRNILNNKKTLKPTQYLRALNREVLAISTEVKFKIPKRRLNRLTDNDDKKCMEVWKPKRNKNKFSHFDGYYLNKINKGKYNNISNDFVLSENDPDVQRCQYCGHGAVKDTMIINWVQCDLCKKWVHQECVKNNNEIFDPAKDFLCQICKIEETILNTKHKQIDSVPNEKKKKINIFK